MTTTLLTAGLACVIAAIIGGGLKAFGIEIPLLQSRTRQTVLAIFGLGLFSTVYFITQPQVIPREIDIFDNKNIYKVSENPPRPAEFEIAQPYHITFIWTYHWNENQGSTPGNIRLVRSDGTIFGPWEVTAANLEQKQNWQINPDTTIPTGKYKIIDSDPYTWSWNSASQYMGTSKVKGYPIQGLLRWLP